MTRIEDADTYRPSSHFDARNFRLQGAEATPVESFTVGLSVFLPGGGATVDAAPQEKVYVVLDGDLTVITDQGEQTLGPLDSCCLAVGETRAIENRTTAVAKLLVVASPAVTA